MHVTGEVLFSEAVVTEIEVKQCSHLEVILLNEINLIIDPGECLKYIFSYRVLMS